VEVVQTKGIDEVGVSVVVSFVVRFSLVAVSSSSTRLRPAALSASEPLALAQRAEREGHSRVPYACGRWS